MRLGLCSRSLALSIFSKEGKTKGFGVAAAQANPGSAAYFIHAVQYLLTRLAGTLDRQAHLRFDPDNHSCNFSIHMDQI